MDASFILLAVMVLVLLGQAYLNYRYYNKPLPTTLSEFQILVEHAKVLAVGAQQFYESGQISDKARFDMVFGELTEMFPDTAERRLKIAVEIGVGLMKIMRPQPTQLPAEPVVTEEALATAIEEGVQRAMARGNTGVTG